MMTIKQIMALPDEDLSEIWRAVKYRRSRMGTLTNKQSLSWDAFRGFYSSKHHILRLDPQDVENIRVLLDMITQYNTGYYVQSLFQKANAYNNAHKAICMESDAVVEDIVAAMAIYRVAPRIPKKYAEACKRVRDKIFGGDDVGEIEEAEG